MSSFFGSLGSTGSSPPKGNSSSALTSLDSKISSLFSKDPDLNVKSFQQPSKLETRELFSRNETTTIISPTGTTRSLWSKDESKSYSPSQGLSTSISANFKASEANAIAREAAFESKLARDEMIIETEIFKMDEEFLKSQMKMIGNQVNTFNGELASLRHELNIESTERKHLSNMVETYMKGYVDDIEGRLKAHIGEQRETIESLTRALQGSEQNNKNIMEEMNNVRRYLDEDLKRTLTNQFDTYNAIESRVREVTAAFDNHQRSFENHQKGVISNEQQRERFLEEKLNKMKGDFNAELIKVAGMSKDIEAVRSFVERESAERLKVQEALRAEDAKVQKALMDHGTEVKRETGQMMQDIKRALDTESGERSKALERLVKQLDDQKRDVGGQHQAMSDKLRQMVGDETNRLAQQIKDVSAKHDGLKGSVEANLQKSSQDIDGKLQRLQAETADKHRDLLTAVQDGHVALKRELTDHSGLTKAAIEDAIAAERRSRTDAHTAMLSGLEQTLRNEVQRVESGSAAKHQDMKDLVAEADKRTQLALGDMKSYMDGRGGRTDDSLLRLTQASEKLSSELAGHKNDTELRMKDADAQVQRAMADLKTVLEGKSEESIRTLHQATQESMRGVEGRHSALEDLIRQLQQAHMDLTGNMAKLKQDSDRDTDDKVQRAMKDLKGGIDGLQSDWADHKRDVDRDTDAKIQRGLGELSTASDTRHNNAEEILKKLVAAHTELQEELKGHRGDVDGRLRDADAQVQRAISEVKSGMDGRHDKSEEALRKLQLEHADLKGDLNSHKSDSAAAMGRALSDEQRKREEALALLKQAHAEMQAEMARGKGDNDRTLQDVDRKVQQSIAELKNDMSRRHDGHDDALRRQAQEHDGRLRDVMADMERRHDGHIAGLRGLESAFKDHKGETDGKLREVDALLQKAMGELKNEMGGQTQNALSELARAHDELTRELGGVKSSHGQALQDADAKLQQAMAAIRAEMNGNLNDHKNSHASLLQDADAKLRRAMADLKGEMDGKHDGHVDAMQQLRAAHAELQQEMAKHKGEHNAKLEEADAKVMQAMRELQQDMSGKHDSHADTLRTIIQAHQDLQTDLATHKNTHEALLQDADLKVQRAMQDLKGEMNGRHDGHEDAMKQLRDAHAELQREMANHKGVHDAKLEEADAKIMQAMRDLNQDMMGRHDSHQNTLQALAQAHQELQTDLAGHKEALAGSHDALLRDADSKVQRAMADIKGEMDGKHEGHADAIRQLRDAHDELQREMANHKGVQDAKLQEADAKIQQAMRDLQMDMAGKHNQHGDTLNMLAQAHQDLSSDLASHKNRHEALLQDADSRVMQAMADLRGEQNGRHDGHEDAIRQLKAAHAELQQELQNHKGTNDARLQDADAKVQQALSNIMAEMDGRHQSHGDALQKLMQAHQDLQSDLSYHKETSEVRARDVDLKLSKSADDMKMELFGRMDGHDEALQKLRQGHSDLLNDLSNHKNDSTDRLMETDRRIQGSMRELQADLAANHEAKLHSAQRELHERADAHDDSLRKLMQAHSELQGELGHRTSQMGAELRDELQEIDAKHHRTIGELRSGVDDGLGDTRSMISSLQRAHADLQESTQRTERSVKDAGATNLANHEFLTNTLNSMERNLTTLDTEHHARITDLRNHFDRFMKDGLQDQEQQTAQALTALQNAFEERTAGMEQEVNRKLRDTLTELVAEQEELGKSVQKLRSNNWEEQFKRVWEAIDTHTHDVNVEDIEEDTQVTTQIIRPPAVQQVVVPNMEIVKTSVLGSPQQRTILPFGTQRVLQGNMSPTTRPGRALSPTAIIRGNASPRALSPLGSNAGSLTAEVGPATASRVLGKSDIVSTEKIHHHVDLHCGSAIFK